MKPQQRAPERGLAATALADQAERFSAPDVEGDAVQRADVDGRLACHPGKRPPVAAIVLRKIVDAHERLGDCLVHASTSGTRMQRARRLSPMSRISMKFRQAWSRSLHRE